MRRKLLKIFSITIIAVMLSACGNTDSKVDQVIQNQMQEADNKNSKSEEAQKTEGNQVPEAAVAVKTEDAVHDNIKDDIKDNISESVMEDTIDVDLTKLSSTMVYSEVYNMLVAPKNYIGKTVKMRGMFVTYTNQDESQIYPAVIIADATACCSQGIEFLLEGNPTYPEGYPELETEITVIGTYETYLEDGNMYCRLQNARVE